MDEIDCKYYVYLYLKPNGVPFYVGKGKDDRWKDHLREAKKESTGKVDRKTNTIRKILKQGQEPVIKFVDTNISEEQAFELECFLIDEIGRIDLGTGTLTNLTNGGEGLSGLIRDICGENNPNYGKRGEDSIWWGRKHTEETLEQMRLAQAGKPKSEEHKAAMRKPKSEAGRQAIAQARRDSGYKATEETRRKISEASKGRPSPLKGKPLTDEHKQKLSLAGKGRPSPTKGKKVVISAEAEQHLRELMTERNNQIIECPYCGKIGKYVGMIRWHMENCKEKRDVAK